MEEFCIHCSSGWCFCGPPPHRGTDCFCHGNSSDVWAVRVVCLLMGGGSTDTSSCSLVQAQPVPAPRSEAWPRPVPAPWSDAWPSAVPAPRSAARFLPESSGSCQCLSEEGQRRALVPTPTPPSEPPRQLPVVPRQSPGRHLPVVTISSQADTSWWSPSAPLLTAPCCPLLAPTLTPPGERPLAPGPTSPGGPRRHQCRLLPVVLRQPPCRQLPVVLHRLPCRQLPVVHCRSRKFSQS